MLGAGNGGLALAGDLALKGADIHLFEHPSLSENFAPIASAGALTVEDARTGGTEIATLGVATTDLAEALDGVSFVHLIVPVSAQETFYEALLPRLSSGGRTLIIWAGRFGSYRFRKLAREVGISLSAVPVMEVNTLPYGCRRIGPTTVRITARATIIYAAGLPAAEAESGMRMLEEIFPILKRAASPLEAAMRNSGTPVLGVGAMLNLGGIESSSGQFALFREGMTPSVRRAVRGVHHELIAVAAAWGVTIPPYGETVYAHETSIESANFKDSQGGYEGFKLLTGPDRVNHRYTIENVRYGFALIAAMGRARGVPTPLLDGFTAIADEVCGPDFARLGWSLEDLDNLQDQ